MFLHEIPIVLGHQINPIDVKHWASLLHGVNRSQKQDLLLKTPINEMVQGTITSIFCCTISNKIDLLQKRDLLLKTSIFYHLVSREHLLFNK